MTSIRGQMHSVLFNELINIPNMVALIDRKESVKRIQEGSADTMTVIENKIN